VFSFPFTYTIRYPQLLLLVFWGLLEVIFAVFSLESLNSACGIDILLLARIERMAHRADFRMDFFRRAAGLERIATAAMNDYLSIFWMYILFHR